MRKVSVALFIIIYFCGGVQAQDPRESFKFAKFKFDNGDFKESLNYLNQAIEKDPLYINAYFLRADVNFELGQYYNSILDINHIFKIEKTTSSSTADYYLTRAKSFMGLKEYTNAASDLEKSMVISKNNPELYYYSAKLAFANENYTNAISVLNAGIIINPENASFYILRAKINLENLKPIKDSDAYKHVLDDLNVAIALEPDNSKYFLFRSDFLNKMGEAEKAMADYNKVIELSPKKDEAYSKRGVIKMNNFDYRSAILDFTKSILINPNEETNYRYRGLCYSNLEYFSGALKDYTKSIDLLTVQLKNNADKNPLKNTLAETYVLRGHCLNLMGNNAQACRDFLRAHNLGIKKGLNYYRKYCGIY